MKKFAKMSLVAAVAVASMSSAQAKDLSEAIKGVDISGTVVYRYDDKKVKDGSSTVNNNYKVGTTIKSPVNDDISFTSRFLVGSSTGSFVGLDTSTTADSNPGVSLSWANFTYTGIANTSIIAGKQGLATPWTNAVDSDGSEQTGTGILAMSTAGPVTVAAGYFNQTNIVSKEAAEWSIVDDPDTTEVNEYYSSSVSEYNTSIQAQNSRNLMVAGAMASFEGVNLEAWYLDITTADSIYLGANTKFKASDDVTIGLDAKWTTLDEDATNAKKGNWEAGITAKSGIVNLGYAYAKSKRDGDGILNSVAKNGQIGYSVNLNNGVESSMHMFDIGAQVSPELHIGLNYDRVKDKLDGDSAGDDKEVYLQMTYKPSKNFYTYLRLADGEENGNDDYKRGRIQIQYSF